MLLTSAREAELPPPRRRGLQTVELETAPLPGGYALTVDLRATGGIGTVTVNGKPIPQATGGYPGRVRVAAFDPAQPVTIATTAGAGRTLQVRLTGYRLGFPRTCRSSRESAAE